jgi:CheY-like chemotaxis protein
MPDAVLIVDDSPFVRQAIVRDFPSGLALRVIEAADGIDGVDAWVREQPRLVFLDIAMPRMDGFEVLEAMRTRKHGARVVVVTSEPGAAIEARAKALGAHEVLRKPWDSRDVQRVLRDAGLIL